ncbi:hypothetical protein D934_00305 [Xylella fastidiosa subsp. sandyi Ann-1]|uniref:Uncharacterized protein n=1 Tax=Xylella fastidiosa subsp. sandyi Ann-1 TaxID=155920 RepID=A0A060H6I8_XYLFS|nr:hypothetical protein D934_00305 [Xylella fastidiosa subsp. sandyi Ann-1]
MVGPLGEMVGVMVSGCDVCFFKLRRGWVRVLSQAEEVMLRSVCMVLVVGSHQGTGGCYVIRWSIGCVAGHVDAMQWDGWFAQRGGEEVGRECLWGYLRFLFSQCLCMVVLLGKVVE